MEKIQYIDLDKMVKHPENPRYIKEDKFKSLMLSIQEDPKYFEVRPIILSNRTGKNVIIAGNQRYDAAKELGWKNAPATIRTGLTVEQELAILFKDNGSFGAFNWDIITNNGWDDLLQDNDWGVILPVDITIDQPSKKEHVMGEPDVVLEPEFKLEITCRSHEQMDELFNEMSERGLDCKTLVI